MAEPKYAKNVVTLPVRKGKGGSIMAAGAEQLLGFQCSIIYAFAFQPGITGLSTKPHVHNYDEAIFFIGSDPVDFEDLGAEVEMAIGPNEEEKYTFTKATAVVVPKGVPHCPIRTKQISKPYLCMAVSLTGKRED
jgi:hypothetical protein